MNNWQKLCKQVAPLIKGNVPEETYHLSFVSCLMTIFNWNDSNIKDKVSVPMGSSTKEADIVLEGKDFNIVIEMKKPSVMLGNDQAGQLISYMRILGCKYGLLVGNRLKFFYDYDQTKKPNEIMETPVITIDFNENDDEGKTLGELLDYSVCSKEKLYAYSKTKLEAVLYAIKKEQWKRDLAANNYEKIRETIKKGLLPDGYDEDFIQNIVSDMTIFFGKRGNDPEPPVPVNPDRLNALIERALSDFPQIRILKRVSNYIRFATTKMDTLFQCDSSQERSTTWRDGTKYCYWFNVVKEDEYRSCFELGPLNQDANTINKMNQIARKYHKGAVTSNQKYRRICTWNIDVKSLLNLEDEDVINEIRKIIERMFDWEKAHFNDLVT